MTEASHESNVGSIEVAPVRPGEELDWVSLDAFLRKEIPDLEGSFSVLQFPNGSANLTYRVAYGEKHLVVRRPPFGKVAAGGHDMSREYRALSKLWHEYDRAPRALAHSKDETVIGSEFLVVEYRPGVVVWRDIPKSMRHVPNVGKSIGLAVSDALADLHLVDPAACGLEKLGRPDGFVQRQVDGWLSRWEAVKPDVSEDFVAKLGASLRDSLPRPQAVSILHNDFKTDNCQFQEGTPERVFSVFDWDMATLGDPLVDLGTLLNYWPSDADDPFAHVTAVPGLDNLGLPSKFDIIERYALGTGFNVSQVHWYEALGCWRTAIILQQLYDRYLRGESTDERMADRGEMVFDLARRGLNLLGK